MAAQYPFGGDRAAANNARVDSMMGNNGYKRGGKVKDDGVNINISVGQPAKPDAGAGLAAALGAAAGPKPSAPPPPMMPPPGGPMMGGPKPPLGGMPGVGAPAMRRGGKVPNMDAGAGSGPGRLEKTSAEKRSGKR